MNARRTAPNAGAFPDGFLTKLFFSFTDSRRAGMAESNHRGNHQPLTQNQNNRMSEDSGDGARRSNRLGMEGREPQNASPEEEAQHDPSTLEAFGQEGAGIAAKE